MIHLQTFFQLYCIASKENGVIIVNDDDDVGMWKEADVDYFMVIFQNLPGGAEYNDVKVRHNGSFHGCHGVTGQDAGPLAIDRVSWSTY